MQRGTNLYGVCLTEGGTFNRWCTSQQVGNSFDKLKQLILLEEFKSCVPVKVKTYLEEQKVEELQRAATLADDYKLTHQSMSSNVETKSVSPKVPLVFHHKLWIRLPPNHEIKTNQGATE